MKQTVFEVSIIIPVHNAQNTLRRAVASLLQQKDISLEIILVENKSHDASRQICCELAEKYENIKFISIEEANVSYARNVGMKYSTGKYIGFLDTDDYVDDNMYSQLYQGIEKQKAEMAMCEYILERGHGKNKIFNSISEIAAQAEKEEDIPERLAALMLGAREKDEVIIMGSVWRCLYKKEFVQMHGIQFCKDLLIGEDLFFNLQILGKVKKIYISNQPYYHYVYSEKSVTASIRKDTWEMYELLFRVLFEYIEKEKNEEFIIRLFYKVHSISSWLALEFAKLDTSLIERYRLIRNVGRTRKVFLDKLDIKIKTKGWSDFMLKYGCYFCILLIGEAVKIKNRKRKR